MSFEERLAQMKAARERAAEESAKKLREEAELPTTSRIEALAASRKRLAELRVELEKLYDVEGPDALTQNRENLEPVQELIDKYKDEFKALGVGHEEVVRDDAGAVVERRQGVSTADVLKAGFSEGDPESVGAFRASHARVRAAAKRTKEVRREISSEIEGHEVAKPASEGTERMYPKAGPDAPYKARNLREWYVARIDSQIAGLDQEIQRLELSTFAGREKQLEAGKARIAERNKTRPAVATPEELDKAAPLVTQEDVKDGDGLGDAFVVGEIKRGMRARIDETATRRLNKEGLLDQRRDLTAIGRFPDTRRGIEEGYKRLKEKMKTAAEELERHLKGHPKLRSAFEDRFGTKKNAEEYLESAIALEKSGGIVSTTDSLDREIKMLDLVSRDVKHWGRKAEGEVVFPGFADPDALRAVIEDADAYVDTLMHAVRAEPDAFAFTERVEGKPEPVPMQRFHEKTAVNLGRYGEVREFAIDKKTADLAKKKKLPDARSSVEKKIGKITDAAEKTKGVVDVAVERDWQRARVATIQKEYPDIDMRAAHAQAIARDRSVGRNVLHKIPFVETVPPETRAVRIQLKDNDKGSPLAFEALATLSKELRVKKEEAGTLERDLASGGKERRGFFGAARKAEGSESTEAQRGRLAQLNVEIAALTQQAERAERDAQGIRAVLEPLLELDPIAGRINEGDYTLEELIGKIRSVAEELARASVEPEEERRIADFANWSAAAAETASRYDRLRGKKPKK